jgi:hypothetical protein
MKEGLKALDAALDIIVAYRPPTKKKPKPTKPAKNPVKSARK